MWIFTVFATCSHFQRQHLDDYFLYFLTNSLKKTVYQPQSLYQADHKTVTSGQSKHTVAVASQNEGGPSQEGQDFNGLWRRTHS